MARPELPGAAAPIQPTVPPFRWAARTRFSSLLPKCSFIFRMVVVYWSWNCESCPEIKYFSLFLRTALLFQLIPARGRKHTIIRNHDELIRISTYPRKGTETMETILIPIVIPFQLIPARGRKHCFKAKIQKTDGISTYPRKGTETSFEDLLERHLEISTYPRKGTETRNRYQGTE